MSDEEVLTLDDPIEAPEAVETPEAPTPTEDTPEPVDAPTDAPAEPERPKISFDDDQQRFIDEYIIPKQVAKRHEAERRAKELEAQLAEIKPEVENARPEIPPIPDPFDDDFEEQVAKRDEALAAAAKWDAEESVRQEYEQRQQQEMMRQQAAALQQDLQTYTQRSDEMGIAREDLQAYGARVEAMGINLETQPQLTHHIMKMENGPGIVAHLANNPEAAYELQQMSPIEQGAYLSKIQVRSRKKAPSAPPPVEVPEGKAPPSTDPYLKGASFE